MFMPARHRSPGDAAPYRTQGGKGPMRLGYSYRRPDGTAARKYFQSSARRDTDARREIAAALEAFKAELARGAHAHSGRQGFLDYLDDWLRSLAVTQRRPNTRSAYAALVARMHGRIENIPLCELRPSHLDALYARLLKDGYAPRTVGQARAALSGALRQAETLGYIDRSPAGRTTPITIPDREHQILTAAEARRLLTTAEARGDPYLALWWALLTTGARIGEVLGLRWADISNTTITFVGQWGKTTGQPWRWEPTLKSRRSARSVPLFPATSRQLARHHGRQRQGRALMGWPETSTVFVGHNSGDAPIVAVSVRRALARALAAAGIGSARVHDLRHSAATRMLNEGVPLVVVSELLGHASIGITSAIYADVEKPLLIDAITRLGEAIRPDSAAG